MVVWHGVAMDSLKYHLVLPYPTLLCSAGRLPLKLPYGSFKGGLPAGWATCGSLDPFGHHVWTPLDTMLYAYAQTL
jgi:hypothetical protein